MMSASHDIQGGVLIVPGDERHERGIGAAEHDLRDLDPAELRHLDVEEEHVRGRLLPHLKALGPVLRLPHDLDRARGLQQPYQEATERGIIVRYDSSEHRAPRIPVQT